MQVRIDITKMCGDTSSTKSKRWPKKINGSTRMKIFWYDWRSWLCRSQFDLISAPDAMGRDTLPLDIRGWTALVVMGLEN